MPISQQIHCWIHHSLASFIWFKAFSLELTSALIQKHALSTMSTIITCKSSFCWCQRFIIIYMVHVGNSFWWVFILNSFTDKHENNTKFQLTSTNKQQVAMHPSKMGWDSSLLTTVLQIYFNLLYSQCAYVIKLTGIQYFHFIFIYPVQQQRMCFRSDKNSVQWISLHSVASPTRHDQ